MNGFKHGFWGYLGLGLLVLGDGILSLAGGMLGVPTILTYTNLSATPNYLQSIQLVLTVLGGVLVFVGLI